MYFFRYIPYISIEIRCISEAGAASICCIVPCYCKGFFILASSKIPLFDQCTSYTDKRRSCKNVAFQDTQTPCMPGKKIHDVIF